MYESLGNGIPVIGNREILEQERVIRESGGGLTVRYDVSEFADAIIRLLEDQPLREVMSARGKDFVLKNYSYQSIAKKISPYFE